MWECDSFLSIAPLPASRNHEDAVAPRSRTRRLTFEGGRADAFGAGQGERHGLSAVDFTEAHDALHAQGFRLVWLDGFGAGTMARYNGIWERNGGAVQRLRLGESLTRHEAADSANRAAGFNLVDVSSFSVGGTPLHAGLWAEGPVVATEVRYLRSGSQ